jgi:hypothetical protein
MNKMSKLKMVRWTAVVGLLFAVMAASAMPVAAAGQLPGQFLGEAYGNKANAKAGNLATKLGRAAYVVCPCHGTDGNIRSNFVSNVDGGDRYKADKIDSTAQAEKRSGMRAFARTTSRVTNMRALGGLIKADSMEAVATVHANQTSISGSPSGSAITGLKINGESRTVDPGERIDLPGFGYAVFNNVSHFGDGVNTGGVLVEMMRIVITRSNTLDIPIGSVITVAHARAGYTRQENGSVVGAVAWGSKGDSNSSDVQGFFGKTAIASLGCFSKGTSSGSNRVSSTSHPGVFMTGEQLSRVYGEVSSSVALARANSRLEAVDLLDGTLTADVIQGATTASVDGTGGHTSFDGSRFVNLSIMGTPFGDDVAPNTTVDIPGLGTLMLNVQSASHDSDDAQATVEMVVLTVTAANPQNIPIGSEIHLAHARAESHP